MRRAELDCGFLGLDINPSLDHCVKLIVFLRPWQTRTHCCGHIVAHDVSWAVQTGKHLLRTQNVSEQNQKHFLCPGHKICVRNKCCQRGQTEKHLCRQQCGRNNVSSFTRALNALVNEDTLLRTHCCP